MKNILMIVLLTLSSQLSAQANKTTYVLPAVDIATEKSKAIATKDVPLKYAVASNIDDIFHLKGRASQVGIWVQKFDRSWEYHLRLESKNATSLNVGMSEFFLPHSAELWVSTDDKSILRGPYNDTYNKKHGFFWVGDVPADHMNIKITVNDKEKRYLSFKVDKITRGFHKFWEEPSYMSKSGSCNVDVACPEGDGWEAEINSVAVYGYGGQYQCTGQLLNNTAKNGKPIFSTANHCGFTVGNTSANQNHAASFFFLWNYQSQTCRAPGSSQSGTPISKTSFNNRQSGATYLASNPTSDFALVELNQTPSPSYGVEYSGWDRSDIAPNSAVAIHHPNTNAKRISFENDPLTITDYSTSVRGQGTHLMIADWDIGTTERGSSGSGLWNFDHLFIGQLHGGAAACGNDEPDWYGRLAYSWNNGNDAQSRMKDWLDPLNTGQMTLQGSTGCEAPTVSITNNSSNKVGDLLTFESQVSGGAGGYTYQWDIDNDDFADGNNESIQVRYAEKYIGNIYLTVTDAENCASSSSQAVVIDGPEIKLQNAEDSSLYLEQVCGNNDSAIDPGERWQTTLFAENTGDHTAGDAYLALSVANSNTSDAQSDAYGNTINNCESLFIDISETGTLLPWVNGGSQYPSDDEGHTAAITLSEGFDHFGDNVASLVASSNGYLSTSINASGSDWDADCPLPQPPDKDNQGGRIYPLHKDLKASQFYHQFFADCPRPAETGENLACEVFLWKGADFWATTNSTEQVDIQAILYPATSQWVYQYSGSGFDSSNSTIGIQNSQGDDGLSFACGAGNQTDISEAVCVYNKNHQPQFEGSQFVKLETPLIELEDLLPHQNKSSFLTFSVSSDASCDSQFVINHDASVYDEGFNEGENNILTATIGNNGQCNAVSTCDVGGSNNDINPRDGLWWNPLRSGNGIDLHVTNRDSMLYVLYTGNKDRSPIWYIAQNNNESSFNQYFNELTEVNYPNGFSPGGVQTQTPVGWSYTTFIDDKKAIQVRNINDEIFAEKMVMQQFAADETPNQHTGHYYSPNESGWGQSIITLGETRVIVSYIYDESGKPFWTIGSGENNNSTKDVYTAESFCPTCPSLTMISHQIGSMSESFNGQSTGTIHQFQIDNPQGPVLPRAEWNKSNLEIYNLVPEEN
ncbi:MAG: PKD domain-containing protein [Marinicella sp.]